LADPSASIPPPEIWKYGKPESSRMTKWNLGFLGLSRKHLCSWDSKLCVGQLRAEAAKFPGAACSIFGSCC
jgi:hypothetical protein